LNFLFILDGNASPLLQGATRLVRGLHSTLAEFRDDPSGAWFPQVHAEDTPERYSFSAGRSVDAPDASKPGYFPDGCWLALCFDRRNDELILRSDPFLQSRWYWTAIGDAHVFSNSLRNIWKRFGKHLELNRAQVPQMLRYGYLPGAATPLANVFSVRSGQTLHLRNSQIEISQTDLVPPVRAPRDVSTHEIRDVLFEAVRRDIGSADRVVVPLSGGMDSRVILRMALDILPREAVHTLTFGHPGSLDFRIGQYVAKSLGVSNTALPMDTRPLATQAAENFRVGEGMFWSVPEYPVQPLREALPQNTVVLSGYIGDVVFGSYEPDEELNNSAAARQYLHETIDSLSEPSVQELLVGTASTDYSETVMREDGSALRQYESFIYGSHQMNRTNFGLFVHRDKVLYATPFVCADVLRVAYSLTPDERRGERAFFRMIREHYSELWKMPLKSSFGYPAELRHARRTVLARAWRKTLASIDETLGASLGMILYRHPRLNYAHPREWLTAPHREFVVNCLDRLTRFAPLDSRAIQKLRDHSAAGKAIAPGLLKSLITLAQWDETYGSKA
jgi:asparagine synthetase B (glutamine-hydrolysing)